MKSVNMASVWPATAEIHVATVAAEQTSPYLILAVSKKNSDFGDDVINLRIIWLCCFLLWHYILFMQLTSKCGSFTCGLLFHCANAPWIKFSEIFIHFIAPWRLSRLSVMQVVLFPVCRKSVTVVMGVLAGANNSLMCWSKGDFVFCVSPGDTQNKIIYCSLLLEFKGSHLELSQMCFVVKTPSVSVLSGFFLAASRCPSVTQI